MRYGLLVLGLIVCVGSYQGWFGQLYDHATNAALSEDAHLAIDVRCRNKAAGRKVDECRLLLKKLYLSGSLDPDKTLRAYCDEIKTALWGGSRPAPPPLCVRRYGGWQEG